MSRHAYGWSWRRPPCEQDAVTRDALRRRADLAREIPLEVVLRSWDAVRDQQDKSRWHTPRGPLSVTGAKFFNWHDRRGGGGAIDLVMHLSGCDPRQAIDWLWHRHRRCMGANSPTASDSTFTLDPNRPAQGYHACQGHDSPSRLRLPPSTPTNLESVRQYLRQQRCLSEKILASLIDAGKLYADNHGNAVFLMVAGKPNRPVGAELRGTGSRVWRGLAPGTRKNAGYFWIEADRAVRIRD